MSAATLDLLSGQIIDCFGFLASGATLCTFAQKRMLPMRVSAITANVFFIVYGALGAIYPVLILHVILLPLNVKRLREQQTDQAQAHQEPVLQGRNVTLMEEWGRDNRRSSPAMATRRPGSAANRNSRLSGGFRAVS